MSDEEKGEAMEPHEMLTHDDIEAIRAARESGEFPGPREWMARYWTEQAAQPTDPSVAVRAEAGVAGAL